MLAKIKMDAAFGDIYTLKREAMFMSVFDANKLKRTPVISKIGPPPYNMSSFFVEII
jgi:hypothetical protein